MFIGATKSAVLRRHGIRSLEISKVFTLGIKLLLPRRRRRVEIALAVDTQSVGAANQPVVGFLFQGVLAEIPLVLQSPIRLHVVSDQIWPVPIIHIQNLLVGA